MYAYISGAWDRPARHRVHTVAPDGDEKPEGHAEQTVEPLRSEKRPPGQGVHGGTPQIEYDPARHWSRQSSISSLNQSGTRNGSPVSSTRAAPSEGTLRRAFLPRVVVPEGQSRHATALNASVKLPTAQRSQEVMRGLAANVPGMQRSHTVAFCVDTVPCKQSSQISAPDVLPNVPPARRVVRGCQGLSGVIRGCQDCQELSEVVRGCQGLPKVSRGYQGISASGNIGNRPIGGVPAAITNVHLRYTLGGNTTRYPASSHRRSPPQSWCRTSPLLTGDPICMWTLWATFGKVESVGTVRKLMMVLVIYRRLHISIYKNTYSYIYIYIYI